MKKIETIVIYSVGLLGASLGAGFKHSGFTGTIRGISRRESADEALSIGAIDEAYTYDQAQLALEGCDLLILCSPITGILNTITNLGNLTLPQGLIISDVGSTKSEILTLAHDILPAHVTFIGGHPMAGSEKSGPSAADPFLFQNAVYVLTPSANCPQELCSDFAGFLEQHLGCRSVVLDAEVHDTIAATVSHVPHLLAVALVNTAQAIDNEIEGTLDLAAGGFKSLTRIASSPYTMWHDIYQTNKPATQKILTKLIDELTSLQQDLTFDRLEVPFEKAKATRESLATNRKGFLGPLFQIVVMAEDTPGFLARMTTLLYEQHISIKDIELLKIREGEGGSFMLAFSSLEEANNAVETLNTTEFEARLRS